jgi:hypothetical protein
VKEEPRYIQEAFNTKLAFSIDAQFRDYEL